MADPATAPWSDVWRLYFEEQRTFRAVFASLRASGINLPGLDEEDLIHEFLLEKAPNALTVFHPSRGDLRPWLFVVFRRFVLDACRMQWRRTMILSRLKTLSPESEPPRGLDELDSRKVAAALATLSESERRVLSIFLEGDKVSIRSVSAKAGISRTRAKNILDDALDKVATSLRLVPARGTPLKG